MSLSITKYMSKYTITNHFIRKTNTPANLCCYAFSQTRGSSRAHKSMQAHQHHQVMFKQIRMKNNVCSLWLCVTLWLLAWFEYSRYWWSPGILLDKLVNANPKVCTVVAQISELSTSSEETRACAMCARSRSLIKTLLVLLFLVMRTTSEILPGTAGPSGTLAPTETLV